METLEFSNNWNGKILLDVFGTVRRSNTKKYYVNAHLKCTLHGVEMGIVKVVSVRDFIYSGIRDPVAYLDVGKPSHYLATILQRMYAPGGTLPNDEPFMHVIVEYTERNIVNQTAELQKWWKHKAPDSQLNLF